MSGRVLRLADRRPVVAPPPPPLRTDLYADAASELRARLADAEARVQHLRALLALEEGA